MVRAKNFKKKATKKNSRILKNTPKRLEMFLNTVAGKDLKIGITIWFVLMSLLMLFANNLRVQKDSNEIHAAASEISNAITAPWIWQ